MGNIGFPELILIFIVALLVFGPRKLPELGRTLGKALTEFRRASTDLRLAVEEEMRELERHGQEMESKAREALEPTTETLLPDGSVGYGSIDPHPGGSPESAAPAEGPPKVASEPARPEEKPADGDPKPA